MEGLAPQKWYGPKMNGLLSIVTLRKLLDLEIPFISPLLLFYENKKNYITFGPFWMVRQINNVHIYSIMCYFDRDRFCVK